MVLQHLRDEVLGGGLARGAGEGDDVGAQAGDDGPGERPEGGHHVGDDDRRYAHGPGREDAHGPGGQCAFGVVVAVDPLADEGGEQAARPDLAGVVDHGTGDLCGRIRYVVGPPAGDVGDLGEGKGDHWFTSACRTLVVRSGTAA